MEASSNIKTEKNGWLFLEWPFYDVLLIMIVTWINWLMTLHLWDTAWRTMSKKGKKLSRRATKLIAGTTEKKETEFAACLKPDWFKNKNNCLRNWFIWEIFSHRRASPQRNFFVAPGVIAFRKGRTVTLIARLFRKAIRQHYISWALLLIWVYWRKLKTWCNACWPTSIEL